MSETAAEFIEERRDFLYVEVAPSARGEGWDVVLRLDGTYDSEAGASEAAIAIRYRLDHSKD